MSTPILHLPDNITVVTDFELQQLMDIPPFETQQLSEIHDRVTASLQTNKVKSLLYSSQTSLLQEQRTNNLITITTSLCAIIFLGILCFILYSHSRYGRYCVRQTILQSVQRAIPNRKTIKARHKDIQCCSLPMHYCTTWKLKHQETSYR